MNPKFYDPNFVCVKPRTQVADFKLRKPHEVKDKIFIKPDCMTKFAVCDYKGRKETKEMRSAERKQIKLEMEAAAEEARIEKERAEGIEHEEVKGKDKADMVHGPVSWKVVEPPWYTKVPEVLHDGGFEKFANFQRNIAGPVGFDKQKGHTDINKGVHYCPVNEERFTQ
jgi:hypothetical protein